MKTGSRVMTMACRGIALFVLISAAAFAQTPDAPRFEVADVHVSAPTSNPAANQMSAGLMRGGRYEVHRATMVDLVRTAWNVDAEKVLDGPNWLEMDRFDVIAKAPADAKLDAVKLMLRTLLADRFHLVVHNDTRPMFAYALTVGKKPMLKEAAGDGDTGCKFEVQGGPGRGGDGAGAAAPNMPVIVNTCRNMTMEAFAAGLARMPAAQQYVGNNLVADQTALTGAFDFTLKYTPKNAGPNAVGETITLFDAIEKQLGLKLEMAKIPLPVIVVDKVDQKPTPNSPEAAKAFPPAPTEFEVADIKPSSPEERGARLNIQPGGRVDIQNLPLKFLFQQLWGLTDDMIVGAPKSADTDHWESPKRPPPQRATPGRTRRPWISIRSSGC